MDGREFEGALSRAMKADLGRGTEAFRDDLLSRCLAELGSDPHAADDAFSAVLDDADLELLAAAGDISADGGLVSDDSNTSF